MRPPPFQVFLDTYREDVYRFLLHLVGPGEAEDCFQETFLAALRSYPRLRDASNLKSWVLTIAHRKALDAHRARRRRPAPVEAVPETATSTLDGEAGADPVLWRAVRALPPKQRAAVVHRFVGDLAYREIARMMQTSEEAARRSVHEGVRKLREVWN
ncbi:MAG: RNA polymerase sigma factor [Actinomycetota bacterium]